MADYALIDGYLDTLRSSMRWRRDVEDLLAEVEDHLLSAVERFEARGSDRVAAQRSILERFGDPDVLARVFASTPGGGMAVPTTSTQRSGSMAVYAAVLWLVAAVFLVASLVTDDFGNGPYLVYTVAVLAAGILSIAVMLGVSRRHGGLGALGTVGIGIAALGVVVSIVAWAVPIWMGVQGLGHLVFGSAVLRRDIAPRVGTFLISVGFVVGPVVFALGNLAEVGWVDDYGDRPVPWNVSGVTGTVILAAGLWLIGRWLSSEEPADFDRTDVVTA